MSSEAGESANKATSYRRARTLAVALRGATAKYGFRVLKLDTTGSEFKIMAYDFEPEYLVKLNELANPGAKNK